MKTLRKISNFDYKVLTFSGGEQHIELNVRKDELEQVDGAMIVKRIQKSSDIMDVLLLNEILIRKGAKEVHLTMPYIPYARQDRATTENTPRALKVFADLLNSCKFKSVTVIDPHSMVAENLIDNLEIISVKPFLHKFFAKANLSANIVLISPDVGALKKVESYAMSLGIKDVLVAHKERDPSTGEIKGIRLLGEVQEPERKDFVVVDDICDGGRTFTELAKVLPATRRSLSLFVTHGIFSKGVLPLKEAGFDNIGCTDSFLGSYYGGDCPEFAKVKFIPLNI